MAVSARMRVGAGILILLAELAGMSLGFAQTVGATDAWVRIGLPGQTNSVAYMDLTADENLVLVGASSSLAGAVALHEMSMDNGVMRMRERMRLDLPAGRMVSLRPGSYHLMLMDLKRPLKAGDSVPLRLKIVARTGPPIILDVQAEVRAPNEAAVQAHRHMQHMH